MAVVANLHDKRIVELPDGEIFYVITNGRNLMGAYGAEYHGGRPLGDCCLSARPAAQPAWTLDDVPQELRASLKK